MKLEMGDKVKVTAAAIHYDGKKSINLKGWTGTVIGPYSNGISNVKFSYKGSSFNHPIVNAFLALLSSKRNDWMHETI